MPEDTIEVMDLAGNRQLKIEQIEHKPEQMASEGIYQDWYLDVPSGKFRSVIKSIELMEEVHTASTGDFIGYRALCVIRY